MPPLSNCRARTHSAAATASATSAHRGGSWLRTAQFLRLPKPTNPTPLRSGSLRLQACRPGAKEFHCNGPCHKFVPHVVAVWLLRRSLPATATAAAEADHGERDWDVDLKPGSSGYDAALASCNPSSERALSNQTIFWRPN